MTLTRPNPTAPGPAVTSNGQGLVSARASMNVGRLALGVLLVVGLSAGFGLKYAEAGKRKAVLAVARAVPVGQPIVAEDLTEARVSADPALHPIAASELDSIVGQAAAVPLLPGTLLSRAHLASGPVVPAGRDVVGISLKPGQVPLGVRPGDPVIVVRTPTSQVGASDTENTILVMARNAQVVAVSPPSANSGGSTVVSVVVDALDAPSVAAAAASGQASLVIEGGR